MYKIRSERAGSTILQKVPGESFNAFIPNSLPPAPPLRMDDDMNLLLDNASRALGKLEGMTYLLPDTDIFIYQFIRKEAVLSAQIEGTQTTLVEFLSAERDQSEKSDAFTEVSNYITAMNYGLERLKELPLSSRLIKEIHAKLLAGSRGSEKQPGIFRTSQNWIGGTRPGNANFVPPPADKVIECISDLEKYLNDTVLKIPTIIKAGLAHAQFETIHPFPDGNGRLGRLLITFILCYEEVLSQPLLYLSLFLKENRSEYYERLDAIRRDGDWEGWIMFYLRGIEQVSNQAFQTARQIIDMKNRHRIEIQSNGKLVNSALSIHEILFKSPIVSINNVVRNIDIAYPNANKAISVLENIDILKEITGRKKNKVYEYSEYLNIIRKGTDYKL